MDAVTLSDSSCVEQSYTAMSAYVTYVEQRPPATFSTPRSVPRAISQHQFPNAITTTATTPVAVIASGSNTYALLSTEGRVLALPNTLRSLPEWYSLQKSLSPESILRYSAVRDFLQMERAVNYQAMDQMYKLVISEFGGDADFDYELIESDGEDPYLILTVSTKGLDMAQIVEKEMRVFEVIARSPTLSSANKYHVISAI